MAKKGKIDKRATLVVNCPVEMKAWLEKRAVAEYDTITSQVLRCIAAEMERQKSQRATERA
jgi:hypothetical protein